LTGLSARDSFTQSHYQPLGELLHELSIAQSLLEIVLQEAAAHGASRVTKVGVKVGAYSAVVPDALRFSFDLITPGTLAEGAALLIEEVPLKGVCQDCGRDIDLSSLVHQCPHCQSNQIKLTQGQELYIDYLEAD
jgi:hydrogenase nickel incorporation protein HypA/HybF